MILEQEIREGKYSPECLSMGMRKDLNFNILLQCEACLGDVLRLESKYLLLYDIDFCCLDRMYVFLYDDVVFFSIIFASTTI